MNPYPWVPGLHGKEVLVVEAVFPLTLAGEVQLGVLPVLALCGGEEHQGTGWKEV